VCITVWFMQSPTYTPLYLHKLTTVLSNKAELENAIVLLENVASLFVSECALLVDTFHAGQWSCVLACSHHHHHTTARTHCTLLHLLAPCLHLACDSCWRALASPHLQPTPGSTRRELWRALPVNSNVHISANQTTGERAGRDTYSST
jgi:hypothetical protein